MSSEKKKRLPDAIPVDGSKPVKAKKPPTVTQPSGMTFHVASDAEKKFYEGQKKKYLGEFEFTASTDLADLDRLLTQELLTFRWTTQLASGVDYDGDPLSPLGEDQLRKNLGDADKTIALIKRSLGMTREVRDQSKESPQEYISTLLARAKEFGVHRTRQVDEALILMNEIKSNVLTFFRSNEAERRRTFRTEADLLEWIRDDAIPRFDKVDADWAKSTQRFWGQM